MSFPILKNILRPTLSGWMIPPVSNPGYLNMLLFMILKEFLPSQMVNDFGQTMSNLCL